MSRLTLAVLALLLLPLCAPLIPALAQDQGSSRPTVRSGSESGSASTAEGRGGNRASTAEGGGGDRATTLGNAGPGSSPTLQSGEESSDSPTLRSGDAGDRATTRVGDGVSDQMQAPGSIGRDFDDGSSGVPGGTGGTVILQAPAMGSGVAPDALRGGAIGRGSGSGSMADELDASDIRAGCRPGDVSSNGIIC